VTWLGGWGRKITCELEASLSYIVRPCFKKKNTTFALQGDYSLESKTQNRNRVPNIVNRNRLRESLWEFIEEYRTFWQSSSIHSPKLHSYKKHIQRAKIGDKGYSCVRLIGMLRSYIHCYRSLLKSFFWVAQIMYAQVS
jgi:hypothetical protein